MNLDQAVETYRRALADGDHDAVEELLDSFEGDDRDALLARIDTEVLGPEELHQTPSEARASFTELGMDERDAAFFASLTHSQLGEHVALAMQRGGISLDALAERVAAELGLPGDAAVRARVRNALDNLVTGRNWQEHRLAPRALEAVAAVIGSTGSALRAMVQRNPLPRIALEGGALPAAARADSEHQVTLDAAAAATDDDEVDALFFRELSR